MCKSPRAVQVTGKMAHIQSVWKRLLSPIGHFFYFKTKYILPFNCDLYLIS